MRARIGENEDNFKAIITQMNDIMKRHFPFKILEIPRDENFQKPENKSCVYKREAEYLLTKIEEELY